MFLDFHIAVQKCVSHVFPDFHIKIQKYVIRVPRFSQ